MDLSPAIAPELNKLLDFVRQNSAYYQELWKDVPENGTAPLNAYPVVDQASYWAANMSSRNEVLTGPHVSGIVLKTGGKDFCLLRRNTTIMLRNKRINHSPQNYVLLERRASNGELTPRAGYQSSRYQSVRSDREPLPCWRDVWLFPTTRSLNNGLGRPSRPSANRRLIFVRNKNPAHARAICHRDILYRHNARQARRTPLGTRRDDARDSCTDVLRRSILRKPAQSRAASLPFC